MILTEAERVRRLPWLVGAETLNIMFVLLTFSGSVFILFLDELGLDNAQIGFLLSLVPFCGIIAPFIAPTVTRFGYKRVYVTFWGIRDIFIALLLFTPLILARYDTQGVFIWVAGIIFAFAICRAIAETGGYLWKKEAVPDAIRGKYGAINSMSTTVASIIVVAAAGYVIDSRTGLNRFMLLIAVGVVMGLLSVVAYSRVPAEGPRQVSQRDKSHTQGMKLALKNRNFMFFLVVLGLAAIGGRAVISFIPLFMKTEVGLSDGIIVLLSVGTYIGALLTSYLWGWAADRYGSKPVMQTSLYLLLLLPVLWAMLPRNSAASAPLAMAIAFVAGVATLAWQISWTRYLFVNALPETNRAAFMAVYYAWIGIVSGIGPLLAGQILTAAEDLSLQVGWFTIDTYTPLFVLSFVLLLLSTRVVSRLQTEGSTTFRHFAGMFLRGNPVKALRLLIQYNFAGDEMTRVTTTEQMGDAHSLLSSEELIESLDDPSFEVRYGAIMAIGRLPVSTELVKALIKVVENNESELSIVATRALGRLGDGRAIPALRRSLSSGYPPLEASSARALARLDDRKSIPTFLHKFNAESNARLRIAYASALGKIKAQEALPLLFTELNQAVSDTARWEIALAIARVVGDERFFLQHWREFHATAVTTAAPIAIQALRKSIRKCSIDVLDTVATGCQQQFEEGKPVPGIACLHTMIEWVLEEPPPETAVYPLEACAQALEQCGDSRPEFVLLSLHTLDATLQRMGA